MDLRKWKEPLKNPYPRKIRNGKFFHAVTPRELNIAKWEIKTWRTGKFSFDEEVHWFKKSTLQTNIQARTR